MKDREIEVGRFQIVEMSNGSFWISCEGGEGMRVSEEKLEKLIAEFYNKEF